MITATAPRPAPATIDLYGAVWELYFRADKAPVQTLQACAVWISAPAPVDAILTGSRT